MKVVKKKNSNEVNRLWGLWDTPTQKHQASGIYAGGGIMTCLMSSIANNGQPCVIVKNENK